MSWLIKYQVDYLLFIHGVVFILLFGIIHLINQYEKLNIKWKYLGLFYLLFGIYKWLEVPVISFGDNNKFFLFRLLLLLSAFIFLFEFWRSNMERVYAKKVKIWIYLPLTFVSSAGLIRGLEGLSVSINYITGIAGALLTVIIIWKYKKLFYPKNISIIIASISIFIHNLINIITLGKKDFFPLSIINYNDFLNFSGFPVDIILCLLSFIILASIWFHYLSLKSQEYSLKETGFFSKHRFIISPAIILISGFFLTQMIGRYMENKEKEYVLYQTQFAAASIDVEKVKTLYWSEEDLNNESYLELKKTLMNLRPSNPDCRFVSLMGLKENGLYVLIDSEPPDSEDYSPPGQFYEEADEMLIDFYKQQNSMVMGPVSDRWGSWISAYVHIYTPPDGENAVAIAVDFDAIYWYASVAKQRLAGIIITLLFSILLFVFFISQQFDEMLRIRTERSSYFRGVLLDLAKGHDADINKAIKKITETVSKTLKVERASIWIYNEDNTVLKCKDLYCLTENKHEEGSILKVSDYPAYFQLIHDKRTILADDARNDISTAEFSNNYLIPLKITSMLDTVVFWQGKIVATLCIEEVVKKRHWTLEEQEFAVSIADMVSLLLETSERQKAQDSERQRTRELETLLDSIPGFAFFKDNNFNYITANKIFCDMVGLSKDKLYGKRDQELFSVKRADKYFKDDGLIISGEKTFLELEEEITDKGKRSVLSVRKIPLKDDSGAIIGLIGLGFDITEKKNLEIQLRQAQKMESIGTLAGGIAHDFNNILAIIRGYTELTMNDLEDNTSTYNNLNQSLKAINRGKELIKQILVFSRQEEDEIKTVDLTNLVKDILKLIRSSMPSMIEIRQNILSKESLFQGDPIQIHQILINLCSNASHAMMPKGGGILEVSLDNIQIKPEDEIAFKLKLKPAFYIKLSVSDTGNGMEEDVIDKIFTPFFTTKTKDEGSGMGLAIVEKIVKSYNGAIDVKSKPQKGSRFDIYLPGYEGEFSEESISKIKDIKTGNEVILLVDDEETLLKIQKEMLEAWGYVVETENNGPNALKLFNSNPDRYDLIITDYSMPQMTGLEFAKRVLAIKKDMPVILCTGFNELVNRNKVLEEGIKELILKPFSFTEITEKIRSVLDESRYS